MLTLEEAAALLRGFERVLILTHVRPDGDTVGCAAALCAALRQLGKTAYLLPNPELTRSTAPYFAPYAAPEHFVPEKVVSVDIAALSLLPEELVTNPTFNPPQDVIDRCKFFHDVADAASVYDRIWVEVTAN